MFRKVANITFLAILGLCLAGVPETTITKATDTIYVQLNTAWYPMDASGNLLVCLFSSNDGINQVSVQRRGQDGKYTELTRLVDEYKTPYIMGNWIMVPNSLSGPNWNLYRIEGDTVTLNQTLSAEDYASASFFDNGNVLVGEFSGPPSAWDFYVFNNGKWEVGNTLIIGDHVVRTSQGYMSRDGKFVVTSNDTSIEVWEFESTGPTFNKIESLSYDALYKDVIVYNGLDTVITTSYTFGTTNYGAMKVYTKTNGQWTNTQTVTADDLGLRPIAYFGTNALFIDADTLVVTAVYENSNYNSAGRSPSGACVIFRRGVDGKWNQTEHLVVDPADSVSFGMSLVLGTNYELLVPGFNVNNGPKNVVGYIYSTQIIPANAPVVNSPSTTPSPSTPSGSAPLAGTPTATTTPVKGPIGKTSGATVITVFSALLLALVLAL